MTQFAKIGGFLELELPRGAPVGVSVWDHLTMNATQLVERSTARGALATLIAAARPAKIWYPAYFCPHAVLPGSDARVDFYPVGAELDPNREWLEPKLSPGDMVVAVDFFGHAPSDTFRDLVCRRPDVFWVEDRAQALSPGPPWGDWLIHSPRKLFGVPDGGLAVCHNQDKALDVPPPKDGADFERQLERLLPLYWRFEDRTQSQNARWYEKFRSAEQAVWRADEPISRLTVDLLRSIDVKHSVEKRLENARTLHRLVPPKLRLFPDEPHTPLLAYPILMPSDDRDEVARNLAAQGIFCAIHWREQISPAADFSTEHALSRRILSLPCDQRYGPAEMERISRCLLAEN